MEVKICRKCGKEMPATNEYFGNRKRTSDGLEPNCKECKKQYDRQYSERNKEKLKEYHKQYRKKNEEQLKEKNLLKYKRNRDEILKQHKEWRNKNKERAREYNKRWREQNKEKVDRDKKTYAEQNKEKILETKRQYRKNNKEKFKAWAKNTQKRRLEQHACETRKRESLKRNLPSTLTADQWKETKKYFNGKCAYCGETHKLTQDHFIALSKGGGYTFDNIIPACASCNSSKCNKDFFEWYPKQDFYSKERETAILEFLDLAKEEAI